MSLIYRILYLTMALSGGYALLVVLLNMLPVWPYPEEVSAAISWLLSVFSILNWLLPMDTMIQVFVLILMVENWRFFWKIAMSLYRTVLWLVAGSGQATTGGTI